MKATMFFGKFLTAMVCMLSMALSNANAQETVFVFEGTNPGDFATAHSATDFSTYEQTTLKITGPLNGDDINCINDAVFAHFGELDLGEAKITSEGTYAYSSSNYSMEADTIGKYMFYNQPLVRVVLPSGVKSIGIYAFQKCSSLSAVALPDSLVSIGTYAFGACTSLQELEMPNTVTTIDSYAFYGCSNLSRVVLSEDLTTLSNNLFDKCASLQNVSLPSGVTTLPKNLFYDCTSLQTVEMSDSVTSIGDHCFYGCSSLQDFELPKSLKTIGGSAFYNCASLTAMTVPEGVKSIPNYLFYGCTNLRTVNVAPDITSIGAYAFYNCALLEDFAIPQTVTSLGSAAFSGCASLTSVAVPEGITTVPTYLCTGCTSLVDVTLPSTITTIEREAFNGCTSLRSVELPDGLAIINSNAFNGAALESVKLPFSVTSIGLRAFANCDNLTTFTVNEGCTTMNGSASVWEGCDNLAVVYLPSTLTTLHYSAFTETSIKEVHIKATTPPTVSSYAVGKAGMTLYVPAGYADTYKANSLWAANWTAILEESYNLAGLTEKEWNILKRIPELTGGADWNTMWTFGATPEETDLLHGVTISGGHVVSLALNGNNLSGRIPHIAFALDSLRSLNLAGNNLSGNIEMDYVDEDYDYQSVTLRADSLKLLDISGNQLTGDLYDVMTFAPNLTTLRANNNRISEISSPLPVYTLQYDGQDLRGIYSPTYSELFNLIGEPDEVVPSVLSYMNYDNSTESSNVDGYKNSIRIFLSEIWGENSEDYWYGSLSKYFKSNSTMSYYYSGSWCDGWYMTPTGRELVASIGSFSSSWDGRHRFSVVMDYEMGDVDFDTQVNVSDL